MKNHKPTTFKCAVSRDGLSSFKAKSLYKKMLRYVVRGVLKEYTCISNLVSECDDSDNRSMVLTYSDRSPFHPRTFTIEISLMTIAEGLYEFSAHVVSECGNMEVVESVKNHIMTFMTEL